MPNPDESERNAAARKLGRVGEKLLKNSSVHKLLPLLQVMSLMNFGTKFNNIVTTGLPSLLNFDFLFLVF